MINNKKLNPIETEHVHCFYYTIIFYSVKRSYTKQSTLFYYEDSK